MKNSEDIETHTAAHDRKKLVHPDVTMRIIDSWKKSYTDEAPLLDLMFIEIGVVIAASLDKTPSILNRVCIHRTFNKEFNKIASSYIIQKIVLYFLENSSQQKSFLTMCQDAVQRLSSNHLWTTEK